MSVPERPGFYRATVGDQPDVLIVVTDDQDACPILSATRVGTHWHSKSEITDLRRVYAITLDDADVPGFLDDLRGGLSGQRAEAIADQIEAQFAPPIPEPGKYAVVIARTAGRAEPDEWFNTGEGWLGSSTHWMRDWSDLVGSVLLREGIS